MKSENIYLSFFEPNNNRAKKLIFAHVIVSLLRVLVGKGLLRTLVVIILLRALVVIILLGVVIGFIEISP